MKTSILLVFLASFATPVFGVGDSSLFITARDGYSYSINFHPGYVRLVSVHTEIPVSSETKIIHNGKILWNGKSNIWYYTYFLRQDSSYRTYSVRKKDTNIFIVSPVSNPAFALDTTTLSISSKEKNWINSDVFAEIIRDSVVLDTGFVVRLSLNKLGPDNETINTVSWRFYNLNRSEDILVDALTGKVLASKQFFWSIPITIGGGIFNAIVEDSSGGIIALSRGTALYRSIDNGNSWYQIKKPASTQAIAVAPNGDIFIGIDNGLLRYRLSDSSLISILGYPGSPKDIAINTKGDIFLTHSTALMRSRDGGKSWINLTTWANDSTNFPFDEALIHSIGINSRDVLFCGLLPRKGSKLSPAVYRSFDDGDTWHRTALEGLETNEFSFSANGTIFAGTHGGGAVFRSDDDGATWEAIGKMSSAITLAVTPKGALLEGDWYGGLFRSGNGGEAWEEILNGQHYINVNALLATKSGVVFYNSMRGTFRSEDEGRTWRKTIEGVFTGGPFIANLKNEILSNFYKTKDNGVTWQQSVSDTSFNDSFWFDSFALHGSGSIFATGVYLTGGKNGVYRSDDEGITWTEVATGIAEGSRNIVINKQGHLIVGGWYSRDMGKIWERTGVVGEIVCLNKKGHIFIGDNSRGGNFDSGVWRSADNGETWQNVLPGMTITALVADTAGRIIASTIYYEMFRSDTNGLNFTLLDNARYYISAVDSTSTLYTDNVSTQSRDNGATWEELFPGKPMEEQQRVSNVYASPTGYMFASSNGIVRSNKRIPTPPVVAAALQDCSSGSYSVHFLSDTLTSVRLIDSLSYNISVHYDTIVPGKSIRFKATLNDALLSGHFAVCALNTMGKQTIYKDVIPVAPIAPIISRNGNTLTSSSSRKYQWFIGDSVLYNDTSQIYKPTRSGNYKVRITDTNWCDAFSEPFAFSTVGVEEYMTDLATSLKQNTPNPFSDRTEITYTIAKSGKIKLDVIDILGNPVVVLYDGFQQIGEHTAEFLIQNIPSGVYYYRLEAEGRMLTKNMTIIR